MLKEELGGAADSLNTALQVAETTIRRLSFTCGATVQLLEEKNDTFLCFDKPKGVWRLTLIIDGKHEDLLSSPLRLRVAAAKAMPFLVNALMDAQSIKAREVASVARQLNEFTDSLLDDSEVKNG